MKILSTIVISLISFSSISHAAVNGLAMTTKNDKIILSLDCINAVNKIEPEPGVLDSVHFMLDKPCSEQLSAFTVKNVGSTMTIEYKEARVWSGLIVSKLSSNFSISSSSANQMILRQLLTDAEKK
ncbi:MULTISPECIES: hypothetical protein [unclassified Brenneria]|uniref:hypothetical protein n=1 Tax=unclassified Brenneria TaxID=2634434 RepID=UPI0029C4AC0F|nr:MULTISPECIES: hypothetical protein [unclassified Brenneria]MDX5626642.1 hypothetical protein [Brenneria sp. L3-3Z]MDX5694008.1 hypothetical protein [Brenneria sp. L4-2C]